MGILLFSTNESPLQEMKPDLGSKFCTYAIKEYSIHKIGNQLANLCKVLHTHHLPNHEEKWAETK